jgi:hypothetical protein
LFKGYLSGHVGANSVEKISRNHGIGHFELSRLDAAFLSLRGKTEKLSFKSTAGTTSSVVFLLLALVVSPPLLVVHSQSFPEYSVLYRLKEVVTMANDDMEVRSASFGEETMSVDKTDGIDITDKGVVVDHGLHRSLKQRHMHMIALGGVVGYNIRL